jgi:cytochrome c-type biogenesis protein CcmH/NrfG
MTNESIVDLPAPPPLRAMQVYFMATLCLAVGLCVGYLVSAPSSASTAQRNMPQYTATPNAMPAGHHFGLQEMRQLSDKQAAPLLEKLKSNPNDTALLARVAALYHTTHRFKEAADYYNRAIQLDPKNVPLRTKLASSLYRNGDIDGAIAQLNIALKSEPSDANAQFDLGMIKLQGKSDAKGAVSTWQHLLKTNPQLSPDRKAAVMKMIANAMTMMGDQHGIEGAQASNGNR